MKMQQQPDVLTQELCFISANHGWLTKLTKHISAGSVSSPAHLGANNKSASIIDCG
jgi:hypothetical protein